MQDPRSYFVTKLTLVPQAARCRIDFPPPAATEAPGPDFPRSAELTLDWLFDTYKGRTLSDRVLARLIQSEAHEADIWLRQDYRQAQICLSLAMRGNTEPFLVSSYTVYGVHPDKVWPRIMSVRKAKLGKEFSDWYSADGILRPDVPKKDSARSGLEHALNTGAEPTAPTQQSAPVPKKPVALILFPKERQA